MDFARNMQQFGGSNVVDYNFNCHQPGFMSNGFNLNATDYNSSTGGGLMEPAQRTRQPTVTGTSVIGCKYIGGVVIAADTLGSYGSMARFRDVSRVMKVNNTTVMAGAGDYADYQHLKERLEQMTIDEQVQDDGFEMPPQAVHSYLTRLMYQRRSKFNPLWNTLTVAGFKNGQAFLGSVDKIGIAFEAPTIASGFGAYLAQPLLRKAQEEDPAKFNYEKARKVVEDCLRVLYYRDGRSYNRYEIAIIDESGVRIEKPQSVSTSWEIAKMVKGFE